MKELGNGFHIVNNSDELKQVERAAGYRGHDTCADYLGGDGPAEYPAIVICEFSGEDQSGRSCYRTQVITAEMAWSLLWAKAERRAQG